MANILVIDDDPLIRELLATELGRAGHSVTVAWDGWDGIKKFRPYFHELVITDVCMPQVNGADLLRVLRREAPDVPVLAITGHLSPDENPAPETAKHLISELGASRVLRKPFSHSELCDAIQRSLSSRPSVPSASMPLRAGG